MTHRVRQSNAPVALAHAAIDSMIGKIVAWYDSLLYGPCPCSTECDSSRRVFFFPQV